MCKELNVSKSGYYKYLKRLLFVSQKETLCIEKVKTYRKILPYVGTNKLWKMLEKDEIKIGRQHLDKMLKVRNMQVKRKRRYTKTSLSDGSKVYPNLLPGKVINKKNQVWITDITYIPKQQGFYYLFVLSDMYTRQIIDYCVSSNMHTSNHLSMLKRQIKEQNIKGNLIHHSDHGSQYTSKETCNLLRSHDISISMTGIAKCYDNAIAERINGILKHEFGLKRVFKSIDSLKIAVKDSVYIYNRLRPHESLNYLTPDEFASQVPDSLTQDKNDRQD